MIFELLVVLQNSFVCNDEQGLRFAVLRSYLFTTPPYPVRTYFLLLPPPPSGRLLPLSNAADPSELRVRTLVRNRVPNTRPHSHPSYFSAL